MPNDDPRLTRLSYLHADNNEPEVGNLFRRHLPLGPALLDADLERACRWSDWQRLRNRAHEAIQNLQRHIHALDLEAEALSRIAGDAIALRGYLADAGHIAFTLEQLVHPDGSAIQKRPMVAKAVNESIKL